MTRQNYKRKLKLKAQKFLENHRHITNFSSAPNSPTSRSEEKHQQCSATALCSLSDIQNGSGSSRKSNPGAEGQVPCGPVGNYIRMFTRKHTLLHRTVLGFSNAREQCGRCHNYSRVPPGSRWFVHQNCGQSLTRTECDHN